MTKEETISKFHNGKLIKISRLLFLLLIFLAPLFFLPLTILPVEINKQYMALLLVVFSFVFYLSNAISTKTIIYPRSFFTSLIIAIFIMIGISSFFSEAKNVSFFGNLFQPDSLISFFIYLLAFIISSTAFTKKDLVLLGIAFFTSTILAFIIGIMQMKGIFYLPFNFAKSSGFNTVGTISDYGFFSAFVIILVMSMASEFRLALLPKIVLAMSGILALINLIIINNKLLWALISVAMLLIVARKFAESVDPRQSENTSKHKLGKTDLSLAVMIISFLFFIIGPSLPPLADLPIEIKPNLSSTIDVAKYDFSVKNIVVGSGPSTFSYKFAINRPVELNKTDFWAIRFNQGYSFISTSVSAIGILGTAILAILVLYLALFVVKNSGNNKLFSISLGVLFLSAAWFFHSAYFIQMLSIFIGLGLISTLNCSCGGIALEKIPKNFSFSIFILAVISITGSLAVFLIFSQKYFAAIYYQKGLESKDIENVLKNFDLAIKLDPDSDLYLRTASQSLIIDANDEASKKDKSSPDSLNARIQNDIALSVQIAQKATVINPVDPLNWANLANVYEQIMPLVDGADLFAENNYKEAIKRDPKNYELEFSLARSLITSADKIKASEPQKKDDSKTIIDSGWQEKLDQANSHLERSIELNDAYAPAHFQIAMILVRKGETENAIKKLEETKLIAPYDSSLAFQLGFIYYENGNIDNAQSEFERAISLNENYSDARYMLGLIYDKQKKKDQAIAQFEKISELNPDNENIKTILSNLKAGKPALAEELKPQPAKENVSGDIPDPASEESKEQLNISPSAKDQEIPQN